VGLISSFFIRQIELSHHHVETKTGLDAEDAKIEEKKMHSDRGHPSAENGNGKESV
jgi:hypothetical protein